MNNHLEKEVTLLKTRISLQAKEVTDAVRRSQNALAQENQDLAKEIIAHDDAIDEEEVRIEEECLKVLALHQPVAGDLRYIITLLKVNTELERIGDLAENIAERVINLVNLRIPLHEPDMTPMFRAVIQQLEKVLYAFLERDSVLAAQVVASDDAVDAMNRNHYHRILQLLKEMPERAEMLTDFLNISRNLERIADGCTNIGEDVLYLEQGKIVRHTHSFQPQ